VISSSQSSITFGWSAPTDNGGTPIRDYKVYWNSGIDNSPFVLLSGTTLGFITYTLQTSITPGITYEFKVVATNSIGDSAFSTKLRVIAASLPDPPINLAKTSQTKTSLSFTWQNGNSGGSAITDYIVYWDAGNPALSTIDFVILSSSTYGVTSFS
jgi:hypothetical protein